MNIRNSEVDDTKKLKNESFPCVLHIMRKRMKMVLLVFLFSLLLFSGLIVFFQNNSNLLYIKSLTKSNIYTESAFIYVAPIQVCTLYVSDSGIESNTVIFNSESELIKTEWFLDLVGKTMDITKYRKERYYEDAKDIHELILKGEIGIIQKGQSIEITVKHRIHSFAIDFVNSIALNYDKLLQVVADDLRKRNDEAMADFNVSHAYKGREDSVRVQNSIIPGHYTIISLATSPEEAVIQNQETGSLGLKSMLIAILFGGLFSIVFTLVWDFSDDRIYEEDDIGSMHSSIGLLGWIPMFASGNHEKSDLIQNENPSSLYNERYKSLVSRLYFHQKTLENVLVFSSILSKEGKTSVAINVSMSLAVAGQRVLLIDAAGWTESTRIDFGLVKNSTGWKDLLNENSGLSKLPPSIAFNKLPNLEILGVSSNEQISINVKDYEQLQLFVIRLKGQYDYIIIDSPSFLTVGNWHPLLAGSDSLIMIIRAGITKKSILEKYILELSEMEDLNFGYILNGVVPELTSRKSEISFWWRNSLPCFTDTHTYKKRILPSLRSVNYYRKRFKAL